MDLSLNLDPVGSGFKDSLVRLVKFIYLLKMKNRTYTIIVRVGDGWKETTQDDMPKEIKLGILKGLIKDFSIEEIWRALVNKD